MRVLVAASACLVGVGCAVGSSPLPLPDHVSIDEDTPVEIAVRDNDFGGGEWALGSGLSEERGSLERRGADSVVYTPRPNFHGEDRFRYSVQNAYGVAFADVTIEVVPDSTLLAPMEVLFQVAEETARVDGVFELGIGDFDGDGLLDLALHGIIDNYHSLVLQLHDGERVVLDRDSQPLDAGHDSRKLVVADTDGDGLDDLVTIGTEQVVFWRHGAGGGAMLHPTVLPVDRRQVRPNLPVVGDFDGDGRADLALSYYSTTHIYSGVAAGLSAPRRFDYHSEWPGDTAGAAMAADLTGDGVEDLLVVEPPNLHVLSWDAGAGDYVRVSVVVPQLGGGAVAVGVAPVDDDGRQDVVLAQQGCVHTLLQVDAGDGVLDFVPRVQQVTERSHGLVVDTTGGRGAPWVLDDALVLLGPAGGNGEYPPRGDAELVRGSAPHLVDYDGDGGLDLVAIENGERVVLLRRR